MRLEQLYPLRPEELQAAVEAFPKKAELCWVQEEPWNMGAWYYVRARFPDIFGKRDIRCMSRVESASPATGSNAAHKLEQSRLLDEALG